MDLRGARPGSVAGALCWGHHLFALAPGNPPDLFLSLPSGWHDDASCPATDPGQRYCSVTKSTRPAWPKAKDRLWGRAQFRRGLRKYERKINARIARSGSGLMRRIRRLLRRFFFVIFRGKP